jgi:SAM-dependent methyltransferase
MDKTTPEAGFLQIDWNLEWKKARERASWRKRRKDVNAFWNKMARRYDTFDNGARERAGQMIDVLGVGPETTIIDVGCGTGNLALPLAEKARRVTAIDPAEAMLNKLKEKAGQRNLTNISTINKKWEDVAIGPDVAPHDIVVASYSLIMVDIQAAFSKMNDAAVRAVCLFWSAGRETWGYDALWPRLFGEPYIHGPDHMYILNVLNQIDIHPDVRITKSTRVQKFRSLEDATQYWTENLGISTPEQRAIIREHLAKTLSREDDWLCSYRETRTAMIWWCKEST